MLFLSVLTLDNIYILLNNKFLWRIDSRYNFVNIRKILQYTCGNLSFSSKDTAITLLYINFDNNFAKINHSIVSHTRRDAKKCVVSKFCPISPGQARVTSLHIIMTYVNDDWRHYSSSLLLIPPHSSSFLLTPPHSSSFLLTPHSSSLLLKNRARTVPIVTSLHIIMTYVNEWRHYKPSLHHTPPHSTTLHHKNRAWTVPILLLTSSLYSFTSIANHVRYSVSISYFTNIPVQNVNKAILLLLDFTASLKCVLCIAKISRD
jgi:hypothetical protein